MVLIKASQKYLNSGTIQLYDPKTVRTYVIYSLFIGFFKDLGNFWCWICVY